MKFKVGDRVVITFWDNPYKGVVRAYLGEKKYLVFLDDREDLTWALESELELIPVVKNSDFMVISKSVNLRLIADDLQEYHKDGWELVTSHSTGDYNIEYIFKRVS